MSEPNWLRPMGAGSARLEVDQDGLDRGRRAVELSGAVLDTDQTETLDHDRAPDHECSAVARAQALRVRPSRQFTPRGGTYMSVILGSGEYRCRVVKDWAQLPEGWEFLDVAGVAIDSKDRLKRPFRDGTTHALFEPLDFSRPRHPASRDISASMHVIARLAALVPRPRSHLIAVALRFVCSP